MFGEALTIPRLATLGAESIYGAMKRKLIGIGALIAQAIALPVLAADPEVLGQFTDWTAFRDAENGKPLCYIGSLPKQAEGDYTRRGRHYVVVALRPAESANGVVTVEAGYPYKLKSRVSVVIDGEERFELFTRNRKNDGNGDAWAEDDAADAALVAAMTAGGQMVVKGTSQRGTLTTDTYSLSGFTRAYKAILEACGVG